MPALPVFHATVAPVTAAQLGRSWHQGCPVGPSRLRTLTVSYVGFDGRPQRGQLVVARGVTDEVTTVFRALYRARFPIHRMIPVAHYGGSDDRSAAADNTSGFNCRRAVAAGMPRWSAHAYGTAIDVNDVENPYLEGGRVIPPAARRTATEPASGRAWRSPAARSSRRSRPSAGSGAAGGPVPRTTSTSLGRAAKLEDI